MDFDIRVLLQEVVEKKASDLHLTVGIPPVFRIYGWLTFSEKYRPLRPPDTEALACSLLGEERWQRFLREREADFSLGLPDLGRFRINAYFQRGSIGLAIRALSYVIPSMEELYLPKEVLQKLALLPRGLILVTGPTGSGKSTTLASMIDYINENRSCHIITIEDPIEYLHPHKGCIVNQREVGADTKSFKNALKYILRQDPDVVLIGEMRDLETIETALTIAETGHLAFATLHTNSCVQTINRIIDVFPPFQQPQVRAQLSMVLEGVLSQVLIPKVGGGRVLALEIMVPNAAIRNLIREEKVHQIYSQMQMGQSKFGMQTMNQSLCDLYVRRLITYEDAIGRSSDPDELIPMIAQQEKVLGFKAGQREDLPRDKYWARDQRARK